MFSLKRFFEQFKILWMQNSQRIFLNMGIFSLILIFSNFLVYNHYIDQISLEFWGFIIAFMTFSSSANVFSSLQQTSSGIHYYMTPGTITEKYAAAWVYSSIFTIFVYSSTIILVFFATNYIGKAITGFNPELSIPSSETLWNGLLGILFYHSFFILGATVFKKNPLLKTLLCIILLFIGIGVILSAILSSYMGGFEEMSAYQWNIELNDWSDLENLFMSIDLETLENIAKMILISIPIILWTTAYFKLKTRQI